MKVIHIPCGPAANESEKKALEHLKSRLQGTPGEDQWILLTNLSFSFTHQLQSDEIDIIAIGPSGVRVIEVKHWNTRWVKQNTDLVEHEADRVTHKARKIGTTLRKAVSNLPFVGGAFLLTQEPSRLKQLPNKIRGVQLHTLTDCRNSIGFGDSAKLSPQQISLLGSTLEPKNRIALDGSLRRLAGYVNLELQSPKEDRFHRIYKGTHSTRQDQVVLHLYDLSVGDENIEVKARREFEALHRLQLYPWAPRILDSFQSVPGYTGEMSFFTMVNPAAPPLAQRKADLSWDTEARLAFSRNTVRALNELHNSGSDDGAIVHRNLTLQTILVKHDNLPMLIGFDRTRIPAEYSVASVGRPVREEDPMAAPEIRVQGLSAADCRSDVYSLCSCLMELFQGTEDEKSKSVADMLAGGQADDPDERTDLTVIEKRIAELLGESISSFVPPPPPARFWTEEQIVQFRHKDYRIVLPLGSGGIGTAFKVVELDQRTKEEIGTYVAKVGHNAEVGERVLHAYNLVRPYLGRHHGLSTIFEVASEWHENDFIALMSWIEGVMLYEYAGVFPLLAEEQQEASGEALALKWLQTMCQSLNVLHRNGLVHGDVSPRNMIVSGTDLVLTDYDFVCKVGEPSKTLGTMLYCPPFRPNHKAEPADDIYALAASFFHVVFETKPFSDGSASAKKRGLNWEQVDRTDYPCFATFLMKATNPDPEKRFQSAKEALLALTSLQISTEQLQTEGIAEEKRYAREVEWLGQLLQSYSGSNWGNQETRGLDSDFAAQTYVPTDLEEILHQDILERRIRLVILCGNAGDGKTALLQHLAERLGLEKSHSSKRILEGQQPDGLVVRMNLDGSASWKDSSADELLDEFLEPFQEGLPQEDIVHLLAINDGRLLEWIENVNETHTSLTEDLSDLLEGQKVREGSHIRFISLNRRSLVGSISSDRETIDTGFLERLLDQLYGGERAPEIWSPCRSCSAQEYCEVYRALQVFGPDRIPGVEPKEKRMRARNRLYEVLQAIHLRGETHITVRELRATLVYILFGIHFCQDYHAAGSQYVAYWERAFSPDSPNRQGKVLHELIRFDPALESHPYVDKHLIRKEKSDSIRQAPCYGGEELTLESARRRAYFEWSEEDIKEFGDSETALELAQSRHLNLFRELPFKDEQERSEICRRLCRGISRLEGLPPSALKRTDVVPLRITPRTPTETEFWVEKDLSSFGLEMGLSLAEAGLSRLHRRVFLRYRYRHGGLEELPLGADLFHLLLELSEGYQLGDVSTNDILTQLSIFVQRLVREDERQLFAWNPMQSEEVYKVSTSVQNTEAGALQPITISALSRDSR